MVPFMTTTNGTKVVRCLVLGAVGLGLVASSEEALAQSSFGHAGSFVISGERLTGVYYNKTSTDGEGFDDGDPVTLDTDTSATTIAFLGAGLGAGPAGVPRVGFDYFLMQSVSLGLSLTYGSRSATDEITGTRQMGMMAPTTFVQEVETTETLFTVNPRVGYAMTFTPLHGLWARGGLAYTRFGVERRAQNIAPGSNVTADSDTSIGVFGLTLDGQLMITPVEHVAIGVGPLFEWSPIGDYDYRETTDHASLDGGASVRSVGLSAGLSLWL
jgi:hypothetical protein